MNNPHSPNKQQMKLMKYLDDFDRQINNRKGSVALQQQLSSLSKAYNKAQQKLLQTEKALMRESILLQKQRSVIDIYKYALNEELDEQGILYFLQQLEQDQTNREIHDDIAEIRTIINRKRMKLTKQCIQEEKMAKELKKEVAKLTQNNSVILEENQSITNTIYQLTLQNQQLLSSLNSTQASLISKEQTLTQTSLHLQREIHTNKKLREEMCSAKKAIQRLVVMQQELNDSKKKWQELQRVLKNKLALPSKENQHINSIQSTPQKEDFLTTLGKKIEQLLKYKAHYKKNKENNELTEFLKKQVTLLKLYLSEEGLELFKEFEQQRLQCIETQIRNLAVLEKGNFLKLQECERDVWKYRIQLIKEDDDLSINASAKYLSQTLKNKAAFSKSSNLGSMMEAMGECQQEKAMGSISEFGD